MICRLCITRTHWSSCRQWLPRNKLEPLGITPELDQIKLIESRKPADRKAVRKAYQEALTHRTQVDKKEEEPKAAEMLLLLNKTILN